MFGDRDAMTTESILAALHELDESPWADIRGKPLNDRGLASRLRRYGVRPKVIRIGDSTPRGYIRADLVDTWLRYLGKPPHGTATSATNATNGDTGTAGAGMEEGEL